MSHRPTREPELESPPPLPARPFKKQILLDDELGRGFPAVVQFGPYLFVSGSDGHRDLQTHQIVPEVAERADEQSRNSYGLARQRLEQAGFGGERAVWIQHFTSGQEWRLHRMGLWPEYFGEIEHGLAVSFGAQAKMSGINMLTTAVVALTPDVERISVAPAPSPGRASRATRAGPFVYVIGVRGHDDPSSHAVAPEEVPGAFQKQAEHCLAWLEAHAQKGGARLSDFVRIDCCIRNVNQTETLRGIMERRFGGTRPFGGYVVGVPLGARLEQEMGGIALAPGEHKQIAWRNGERRAADAVKAGGLIFTDGCRGNQDAVTGDTLPDLYGDRIRQARQAFRRLDCALQHFDASYADILRLDVFLRDIYFEEEFLHIATDFFGASAPTMTIVGADLESGAEIELVAIAGAPDATADEAKGGQP